MSGTVRPPLAGYESLSLKPFFLRQVYLTVLKHGDSATLDTMLKVRQEPLNRPPGFTGHCNRVSVHLWPFSSTNRQTCRRRRIESSECWAPSRPPTSSRRSSPSPSRYVCMSQVWVEDELLWLQPRLTGSPNTDASVFCVRQEDVRPQDTVSVIGGVAGSSKQGRKAAWKFVRDNWEELYNRYQGGFLISRLIKVTKVSRRKSTLVAFSSRLTSFPSSAAHSRRIRR